MVIDVISDCVIFIFLRFLGKGISGKYMDGLRLENFFEIFTLELLFFLISGVATEGVRKRLVSYVYTNTTKLALHFSFLLCRDHRRPGRQPPPSATRLEVSYSGKFESIRVNLKIKNFFLFFRDHTNPIRKKEKISVKTFFIEYSGRFFLPPSRKFCSPTVLRLQFRLI